MAAEEELKLAKEKHVGYVVELDNKRDQYEYWLTEHLRLNGTYWGLMSVVLLKTPDALDKEGIIRFVMECKHNDGGFGPFPRHDAHLHSTLSAIQILKILNSLDLLTTDEINKTVNFITSLQLPDGSFHGDRFGEVDTRFVYTAINCLKLLDKLSIKVIDKAVEFISKCQNFDGGFGNCPGGESHAAMIFVCVATLAICNRLDIIDKPTLVQWLSERQVTNGGLNGRPEKLPDVCYSWWVLSSLSILNEAQLIDFEKLKNFIYKAQDTINGGIADREGNEVDVFHTYFGLAGLSLMGFDNLLPIDPIYALPTHLTTQYHQN
ncbi:hypothetical protein PACTADRAFT_50946 [Pachysolen tannophilus NRRL Y-2460]|uniref:Geranylgeranyl transferase type-2 subunit beta n=1 Tax=Pachysolen tannophilus NRRL Y-2460 TaxID=669874 RepID=A0A1E4TQL1_PACTA|nr:hypothetical protein PACTADRAFT_50946 [Pachysolen tannophilus NRRL Y-2460]